MNCPFCKREIYAMTGLQELKKFEKHLVKCKKNPKRKVFPAFIDEDGNLNPTVNITCTSMMEALEIRANSGQ